MKFWGRIADYIETKIINEIKFSNKWKVLKINHGELIRIVLRIDRLCAKKIPKCKKEYPEGDIFALVIASLPQDLLDRILKDEGMIAKG